MRYSKAIVRTPGRSVIDGLTASNLGKPDYEKALIHHTAYVRALEAAGLHVTVLDPDEEHPDSTFVEDTALLTPYCAIITRPGAPSRRGETVAIEAGLRDYFDEIERIESPGTVDAGDIMMVGRHFYIGISERTNMDGAGQILRILKGYGMTGSTIPLANVLHLKSGVAYLEHNRLLVSGEFIGLPAFDGFETIKVDNDEQYAANCLWINDVVLTASGFPKMNAAIKNLGYQAIPLDMSEFEKLDGGLSCLSLRF